ncbi:hypothetical protein AAG570_006381 [Ranatra chinensis]|uniref:AB hydrolase-1 domain-containing protein n=1 Tax=Ranatra chinensis TaxID=642074 RepID=A0ABD0YTX3_9HEMI
MQDNALSYNSLISLLPQEFYFVCADLPGHGKSDPFVEGLILEITSYILSVKRVIQHFKWAKCYIVGHSLGAQLAFLFSAIYPEVVIKLIMIDGLTPFIVPAEDSPEHFKLCVKEVEKVEHTTRTRLPPSYTYEEALERMKSNRRGSLSDHAAKILLERSLIRSGTGYRFITDQRLKYLIKPLYTMGHVEHFVNRVKCPVLLILAEDSVNDYADVLGDYSHIILNGMIFKKPNFKVVVVSGDHNVHMNYPERVSKHVIQFLVQNCSL